MKTKYKLNILNPQAFKKQETLNKIVYLIPTATAKSRQSCPTLCDPIDGSPPGSPIPGILQARTLEWVAISFSNAWKWKVKVKSLSRVWLVVTPWTAAYQAPPSMRFSRQGYWNGVPLPSPPKNNFKKLQWKIITLTKGGLFPFNQSFIFGVVCQYSSGKLKSTGLRPPCCTQDALLHPWYHTVSIPCPACEAMSLSLGLWSSGCSRNQRASTPHKTLLGWPTDLDSPLRILTPTISAAKLHVARMISPAKGSGNLSISQSGPWSLGETPIQGAFGMAHPVQAHCCAEGECESQHGEEVCPNVSSVPKWDSKLTSSSKLIFGRVPTSSIIATPLCWDLKSLKCPCYNADRLLK